MIINTRADLEALRGTPDWPVALRLLAGSTVGWRRPEGAPAYERNADTSALDRLGMTPTELQAELDAAGIVIDPPQPPPLREVPPEPPPSFLARDLLALLTIVDRRAIGVAIAADDELLLLWEGLLGQGEAPIRTTAQRFQRGWAGLSAALGGARADEIATALGIVPPAS